MHGRTEDLAWSPDGNWLAYSFWTDPRHTAIKLYDVTTKTATLVTQPEFRDFSPAFDPEGKYLYFLSVRTFDPVYDSVQFELSFPRAMRPYLIALAAGGAAAVRPGAKGLKSDDAEAKAAKAAVKATAARDNDGRAGNAPADPPPMRVDLDGIAHRVAPFPVNEGRFAQIAGVAGNKVLWTTLPLVGAHGRGGHKDGPGRLELFDFDTMKRRNAARTRGCVSTLAADATTLVIRDGKRLRALAGNRKPERDDAAAHSDAPSPQERLDRSWPDSRIDRPGGRMGADAARSVAVAARPVLDGGHVGHRLGRRVSALCARCSPRVATRGELSDLIWELQGELGTSHAYEVGGDHRRPPSVALGHLAADVKPVDGGAGYEITRIVRGDPWDAGADSPLNAIGVEARVGERIVAVNGQPVSIDLPPQALLVHQAGSKVELTLADDRRHAQRHRPYAGRRSAGAVPRMGRTQSRMGAPAIEGPRRLLSPAGHAIGRFRRIPSVLRRRMRPRGADRGRALQPRRPRVAAVAGEDRAQASRVYGVALARAVARGRTKRHWGRWWR